jgi:hypothetical protein
MSSELRSFLTLHVVLERRYTRKSWLKVKSRCNAFYAHPLREFIVKL